MTAVVLLPGIGTTQATWDGVAGPLAEKLHVVRPEWRGHDGSAVSPGTATIAGLGADVLAAMDAAGVEQAHVVGLSLGGMVGLWLAAEHPGRVRRLAVICTNTDPDRAMFTERAALVRAEGTAAVAHRSVATWVRAPDARLTAMLQRVDAEGYAQCCEAIAGLDLDLDRVAAPTLVVAGRDDPAAPPAGMRALARALGAGYAEVPGRHLAILEQPRAIADLLLAHLDPTFDAGMAVRRQVLGDAHVDRALAATDPLTADFQDFLTRYAWGEVWNRPGLGRRDRSLVTLGVLVALGAEGEIALHVRAAIRNGLSVGELAEMLQHTALYAGLPRANAAFAIARRVLAEMTSEMEET
jgi:3-oxoadipate enol-lactonase/4-carboxymuconolactone decarboxylase